MHASRYDRRGGVIEVQELGTWPEDGSNRQARFGLGKGAVVTIDSSDLTGGTVEPNLSDLGAPFPTTGRFEVYAPIAVPVDA